MDYSNYFKTGQFYFDQLALYRCKIFESHSMHMLNEILDPWIRIFLNREKDYLSNLNSPIAVIIEDRVSPLLRFSVINTLLMCRLKIKINILTTQDKLFAIRELFNDLKNWVEIIEIPNPEINSIDQKSYNELLKNRKFWASLNSSNILIFQIDSLLIEPIDFSLFKYDFIGAPWVKKEFRTNFPLYKDNLESEDINTYVSTYINTFPEINLENNMKLLIGNGGLSIRNRDTMANICQTFKTDREEQEDIYFSRCLYSIKANLPTLEIAKKFACEGSYSKSIGMHKSYNYLSAEDQAEIYERHLKNLTSLISRLQ